MTNPEKLGNQLVGAEEADVAQGIRALLAMPILHERQAPELFAVIRARRGPIAKWFDHTCGWTLTVEPRAGYARLAKVRASSDGRRPARRERGGRAAFDRRRYTLLCVVAAELLAAPVTTIGLLATRVERATAADAAIPDFDTARRSERLAYVDVLLLLERWHALEALDGATEAFADTAEAKVLYRVDSTLVVRLLASPQGPSRFTTDPEHVPERFDGLLTALVAEPRYGEPGAATDVQRNLQARHSVFRRLLDDPVVHRDELDHAELAYVTSPTGRRLLRDAARRAGMVLEERDEGWMLVDPDAIATDRRFPDDTHTGAAGLLLLDALQRGPDGLTDEQLVRATAGILAREPSWARGYQSDDGADRLASDAVEVLLAFGLVRREGAVVVARPAAARYAVTSSGGGAS